MGSRRSSPHTRCKKLPSDFIEKLPASIIKMCRTAFAFTPLYDQWREQYTLNGEGKLVFKEGVETIKEVKQEDKDKINEIIINDGAKVIGEGAFRWCGGLTAVSVPSTVVEIGKSAFGW